MADEHDKKKKRKPRTIITHRHDGKKGEDTYHHEHLHDDGKTEHFAGTSQNLEDVQQHMADHFGGGAAEPEPAAAGAPAEPAPEQ